MSPPARKREGWRFFTASRFRMTNRWVIVILRSETTKNLPRVGRPNTVHTDRSSRRGDPCGRPQRREQAPALRRIRTGLQPKSLPPWGKVAFAQQMPDEGKPDELLKYSNFHRKHLHFVVVPLFHGIYNILMYNYHEYLYPLV